MKIDRCKHQDTEKANAQVQEAEPSEAFRNGTSNGFQVRVTYIVALDGGEFERVEKVIGEEAKNNRTRASSYQNQPIHIHLPPREVLVALNDGHHESHTSEHPKQYPIHRNEACHAVNVGAN